MAEVKTTQLEGAAPVAPRHLNPEQRQWLTDLYLAHFARVFRVCRRILRNPDDAADAAHEVFLRAAGAYQPRPGEDVSAWLLTVARNYSLDILRRRRRLGRLMVVLSGDRSESADPAASVMDRQAVAAVFEQLRDRERQALWQSAVERRSLAAIAADLQLSYMATAQLLHRARRHAAALAAKLAAIFGLVQLGRMLRRAGPAGSRVAARANQPAAAGVTAHLPQLLAMAAVPLVIAMGSSSSSPSASASLPQLPATVSAPLAPLTLPATVGPLPVPGLGGAGGHLPQVTALPSALPSLPLPSISLPASLPLPSLPAASPVGSMVKGVQQAAPHVTTPTPPNVSNVVSGVPRP